MPEKYRGEKKEEKERIEAWKELFTEVKKQGEIKEKYRTGLVRARAVTTNLIPYKKSDHLLGLLLEQALTGRKIELTEEDKAKIRASVSKYRKKRAKSLKDRKKKLLAELERVEQEIASLEEPPF